MKSANPKPPAVKMSPILKLLDRFDAALRDGSFVKLTLGAPRSADRTLRNVQVRAIDLRGARHLSFVYHHSNRDITKNFAPAEGRALLEELIGADFRNAHLFTTSGSAQLEIRDGRGARLKEGAARHKAPPASHHDQRRQRHVGRDAPWLRALGVSTADGSIAKGMEAKFRQIDRFVEVFESLLDGAGLGTAATLDVVDMGCGKGYLTFATFDWLRQRPGRHVRVRGIEARRELVDLANRIAVENHLDGLSFETGTIAGAKLGSFDVLIALHACDTATDDALARAIEAGARLIIVSPCCHKELRPQLRPPPALAGALRHGILRERQAEFITDALRAALLEWAGYDTKVFEFITTEHTAKNLMIAATRRGADAGRSEADAARVRDLAGFYGIRSLRLAAALGFPLGA